MKTSLTHLPKNKRNELTRIVERIRERVDSIQMIILFGSYARGNWVDDTCTNGHITYEYISDFDILAIVETNKIANSTNLWRRLDKSINAMHLLTPVTIIAHDINFVNRKLKNGQYFFTDIKKEGITLYDSKNFKLARRRRLDPAEDNDRGNNRQFYTIFYPSGDAEIKYGQISGTNGIFSLPTG